MSGWLPGWHHVSDNARSGGGTYGTDFYPYPWRVVWHTTQSSGMPDVRSHRAPPHLWYDPRTRQRVQTVPLDRSSYAMWNEDSHPHYTSKACAVQVELIGFADDAGSWPDQYLRNIAEDVLVPICRWVQSAGGRIDLGQVAPVGVIPGSSYENAPQRLSWQEWADFNGTCGHRNAPGNGDRYDAGLLDMRRIARYAAEILGGTIAPAADPEELTVAQIDQLMKKLDDLQQLQEADLRENRERQHALLETVTRGRVADVDEVVLDTHQRLQGLIEYVHKLGADDLPGAQNPPLSEISAIDLLAELSRRHASGA